METTEDDTRAAAAAATGFWWLFLVTGVIWLLLSLLVLRFNTTSVTTVGVLIGALFLVGAVDEFFIAWAREGWKWLHILLGVVFAIGAIFAFTSPQDTFWAIASIFGLLLVLKGTLDIVVSVATKDVNELWWLGLIVGILEVLLGFWASNPVHPVREAALMILWVGFFCLFRGISEIVVAFGIRKAGKELAAA